MSEKLARIIALPEVFSNKLFRIPDYQRGYAWGADQVSALLDDVEQLLIYDHMHYTGTVVIVESEVTPRKNIEDTVYDVVDGQQRLTTFSMLLVRLINGVSDAKKKDELLNLYVRRGKEGNYIRVLKLNKDIDPFFTKYVIDGDFKNVDLQFVSEKHILEAYKKIDSWVIKQAEKKRSVEDLLDVVTKKFGLLVYCPSESAEAGMMFEVINNRGKPLSELDKVKNYLVYYAIKSNNNDLYEEVNKNWGFILKSLAKAHHLNNPDEMALLRATVICYFGFTKEQSSKIYESIKKRFPLSRSDKDWKKLVDFVKFLSRASLYYECLLNQDSEFRKKLGNQKIVSQIELIRSQAKYASIMPLFFAVMELRDDLENEDTINILKMIEIVNFRVYMTRNGAKRTDSGQAWLFWLAHKFFSKDEKHIKKEQDEYELEYKNIAGFVIAHLYDIVEKYCDDDKFEDGLVLKKSDKDDFYDWGAIRYFLMNYEQYVNPKKTIEIEKILKKRVKGKSLEFLSLEHVWAVANQIKGSRNRKDEDGHSKRRLGNFLLLELAINIQASKYELEKKVKIYDGKNSDEAKSSLKQVHSLIKDYNSIIKAQDAKRKTQNFYRKITVQTINKNEGRYIAFAMKRWSIDWAEKYWSVL